MSTVVFEETIIINHSSLMKSPELHAGDYIALANAKLFSDALTRKHKKYLTGMFCVFSSKKLGSRIKVTDSPTGIHDVNRLLGWVDISSIKGVKTNGRNQNFS